MTKEQINAIPRKQAREFLTQIPLGPGFDDRLLGAVELAMNLEWWRGYHAAQPQSLSGCLHPGNEPMSCQQERRCLSASCDHYGKTEYRPRMTLEAQDPNVLYPNKGE